MTTNTITVIKRDGREVPFTEEAVKRAVLKAFYSTGAEITDAQLDYIVSEVKACALTAYCGKISVEAIQDTVEHLLMNVHKGTAKAFIKYRQARTEEREKRSDLMEFVSDVIDLKNIENENANMPEWVFTAKNVKMSSEISKRYSMNYLLSKDVKDAFTDNRIYIHDFSQYAVGSHNCLTVDLSDVLKRGFTATNGDVRPPSSIRSAMQLTAVVLQCASNVQFGKC